MEKNIISMHSTVAAGANLATMANVARETGFDAIEPEYHMLKNYFNAGMTVEDFKLLTAGLQLPAVGWIEDIEAGGEHFRAIMNRAEWLFELCGRTGIKGVEILTGPLSWDAVKAFREGKPYCGYMGLQGIPEAEQRKKTADNIKLLADAAAQHDVVLYMETLAWTPMRGITNAKEIIDLSGRDNVKICVDFWHCFITGDTPEMIARLPKDYIYGVHVCGSKPYTGGVPSETELRTVALDEGVIPVSKYVEAVKASGYDNWWAGEAMEPKLNQLDIRESARINYDGIKKYVVGI